MNSIPPRNGWNNGAIYPFLVYNGRLRVKLFGAYIWKSLLLNAAFLKLVLLLLMLKYAIKPCCIFKLRHSALYRLPPSYFEKEMI